MAGERHVHRPPGWSLAAHDLLEREGTAAYTRWAVSLPPGAPTDGFLALAGADPWMQQHKACLWAVDMRRLRGDVRLRQPDGPQAESALAQVERR